MDLEKFQFSLKSPHFRTRVEEQFPLSSNLTGPTTCRSRILKKKIYTHRLQKTVGVYWCNNWLPCFSHLVSENIKVREQGVVPLHMNMWWYSRNIKLLTKGSVARSCNGNSRLSPNRNQNINSNGLIPIMLLNIKTFHFMSFVHSSSLRASVPFFS